MFSAMHATLNHLFSDVKILPPCVLVKQRLKLKIKHSCLILDFTYPIESIFKFLKVFIVFSSDRLPLASLKRSRLVLPNRLTENPIFIIKNRKPKTKNRNLIFYPVFRSLPGIILKYSLKITQKVLLFLLKTKNRF